jgi:hypothetical protein
MSGSYENVLAFQWYSYDLLTAWLENYTEEYYYFMYRWRILRGFHIAVDFYMVVYHLYNVQSLDFQGPPLQMALERDWPASKSCPAHNKQQVH